MPPPTSVVVFGILNIIFGLLGFLGTAFSAFVLFGMAGDNPFLAAQGAIMAAWVRITVVLGFLGATMLLVSGIGLLRMRSWGHNLAIAYAIFAVVVAMLGVAVQIFEVLPQIQQAGRGADSAPLIGQAVAGTLGGCIGLIYPLLLWYFVTRPNVVAAFAGTSSAEPLDAQLADSQPAGAGLDFNNPYASPRTASAPPAMHAARGSVESVVETFVPSRNGPALAAYYLGLFSLLPCFGFPLGVAALYLGIRGLRNVRANPEVRGGAHAWVGVICGALFGLFNFVLLLGVVVVLIAEAVRK
jgi:hypothetical protein